MVKAVKSKWIHYAILIIGLITSGGYNQKLSTANNELKTNLQVANPYISQYCDLLERHEQLHENYMYLKKEMVSIRMARVSAPPIPEITAPTMQSIKRSPVSVLGFVNTSSWGMGAGYELGSLSLPKLPRTCFTLSGVAGRTWQDKWEFGGILTLGFEKIVK
jgi:hypothetical protein